MPSCESGPWVCGFCLTEYDWRGKASECCFVPAYYPADEVD